MNILFLTKEYNHPNLPASGGAGTFIKIIAHELSSRGHTVHIFGVAKKKLQFKDDDISLFFVKKFAKKHWLKKLFMSISKKMKLGKIYEKMRLMEYKYWAKELKKYASGKDIDIIEAWDYGAYFMYANILNVPLVIRCHGSAGLLNHYFKYEDLNNFTPLEKIAFKNYDNIIAVSEYGKKINEEWFNKKNLEVIHNGINLKQFNNQYSRDCVIEQSIFYFGTLSEKKGTYDLAEIFNHIITKYPNASLHLIGKGEDIFEDVQLNILSKESNKNTHYYGSLPHTEIAKKLQQAHVLVFPTKGENFPFAFLEAMAIEKPIVTSNIEVAYEIIEHNVNGLIANSIEDYILHISNIFNNPKLANDIASNARNTIEEKFTVELMTKKSLDYYKKVIHEYSTNDDKL